MVVTGGAGFLGSHLCERLLGDGHAVLCVDNFLTGVPDNVGHLLGDDGFVLRRMDVSEPIHVDGPVDAVLHLASPASPVDYLRLPIHTLRAGSLGTLNALELAAEKHARFLLASTSETYGDPQVHPQPETYWGNVNPVGPRSVYDEAKRFAEASTAAYRRSMGVNTGIVRIFNTYGPRMRPDDGRAIPTFIDQALAGRPLTVAGDGSQTRSVCYVDDLIDGLVRMLDADHAGARQHRQPARADGPRARGDGPRAHRVAIRDLLRAPSRRRPRPPTARHHGRAYRPGLGAGGGAHGRAAAHDRVVPGLLRGPPGGGTVATGRELSPAACCRCSHCSGRKPSRAPIVRSSSKRH